ncbi:hypothetical protein [Streptomyces sp. NPDC093970]|uniref:hypothetical protein n=1 Tax=Streptomyces sp. NPDC093970 TaxID=3155076 RepID=UPI00343DFB67
MPEEWQWDDPAIPGESAVFRKVLARPNFIVPNLEGGPPAPAPGAFKCDADGISVYRDELLKSLSLTPEDIKKNTDDHVFGIFVSDVRESGAGVVDSPDDEDEELGPAHSSIRYSAPKIDKPSERRIRERIIDACWLSE